jgi:hypothetical protein
MKAAIMTWAKPIKVYVSGKKQVDYKTIESFRLETIKLFRVPSGQQLQQSGLGQRAWNNETVYVDCKADLNVDDIIVFDCPEGERYRIMNKTDFSNFGFNVFEITNGFQ